MVVVASSMLPHFLPFSTSPPQSLVLHLSLISLQPSNTPSVSDSPFPFFKSLKLKTNVRFLSATITAASPSTASSSDIAPITFHEECYGVGDNINTDQIILAEYMTLIPSNPDKYEKLGSYALIGLPSLYQTRFIESGASKTKYSILIASDNFGCGSSREHAPIALGATGVAGVLAESYARIFFRNSVAIGEVYPLESEGRLCEECRTRDVVTIELSEGNCKLINHTSGTEYKLKHANSGST